jgi:CRISPR-associated endonuclease Csn1
VAWGVESLKKVDGKRVEDARHHALDAVVVAAVGEGEVQRLTKSFQEWEQQGLGRPLRRVDEPWDGFREEVKAALATVFVARPERRRARGEGHAATIRQIVERDDVQRTSERVAVLSLGVTKGKFDETKALKQLGNIKDPNRNGRIVDAVKFWIAAGRPTEASKLPRSPQGDVITKLRLMSSTKPAVQVRGGTADRGEMVRVDVFTKPNKRGKAEFYLVPIYPHQVMNKREHPYPPTKAVAQAKPEEEWFEMTPEYTFRMSLYPRSLLEITKPDGEILEGYFVGLDRATGNIALSDHKDSRTLWRGLGPRKLLTMKKYSVDRFGRRAEVKQEVRTWHGVACTSPSPPG